MSETIYQVFLSKSHADQVGIRGNALDIVRWAAFNDMYYDPGFVNYESNPKDQSLRWRCFDVFRLDNLPLSIEERYAIRRGAPKGSVPSLREVIGEMYDSLRLSS